MNIEGVMSLMATEKVTLKALGAVEDSVMGRSAIRPKGDPLRGIARVRSRKLHASI